MTIFVTAIIVTKMYRFPKSVTGLGSALIHMGAIPLSFIVAALVYVPRGLNALMGSGAAVSSMNDVHYFNIVICFTIMLGVMTLMRIPLLWLLRSHIPMTLWRYGAWCLLEIVLCCAFCALYLGLMDRSSMGGYFYYFGRCLSCIASVIFFPYILLVLIYMVREAPEPGAGLPELRLKFYDFRHQLRFISDSASVVYIESSENYIIVHYLENGVPKRIQIRNSMKNIEPLCEKAGFARAHRCYIVNPVHIKSIVKGSQGNAIAETGIPGMEGIPISKKYYENLTQLLG